MSKSLNVRIVGRGNLTRNYKVYDADTGEELDNVMGVVVRMDASDGIVTADITVHGVELDVEAAGEIETEGGEAIPYFLSRPSGAA